ncbi:MAG: hypothetical protein HZB50_08575 [Chloroflexi bacterium]|nr:hypothetical protein [Chloroflexota bacterium]
MTTGTTFQPWDGIFSLSIAIGVFGILVILSTVWFAWRLTSRSYFVEKQRLSEGIDDDSRHALTEYFNDSRITFWIAYGQIILAVLLIIVLAILILTKSISAEAGLPILSGISGFAIAKGANTHTIGDQSPKYPPSAVQQKEKTEKDILVSPPLEKPSSKKEKK